MKVNKNIEQWLCGASKPSPSTNYGRLLFLLRILSLSFCINANCEVGCFEHSEIPPPSTAKLQHYFEKILCFEMFLDGLCWIRYLRRGFLCLHRGLWFTFANPSLILKYFVRFLKIWVVMISIPQIFWKCQLLWWDLLLYSVQYFHYFPDKFILCLQYIYTICQLGWTPVAAFICLTIYVRTCLVACFELCIKPESQLHVPGLYF